MNEEMLKDHKLISDFWQFWKTHYEIKDLEDDPYWDGLLDDANVFATEHPEPYARILIVSLCRELERRAKCKSGK